MTKEKEAEKIQLVFEKIGRHVLMTFELRMKQNRELLEKSLEKEKDFCRRIDYVSDTKRDNWKAEASANDQLETGKKQAFLTLEALCIKSELTEKLIDSLYYKYYIEVTTKQMEEEAEIENLKNNIN